MYFDIHNFGNLNSAVCYILSIFFFINQEMRSLVHGDTEKNAAKTTAQGEVYVVMILNSFI